MVKQFSWQEVGFSEFKFRGRDVARQVMKWLLLLHRHVHQIPQLDQWSRMIFNLVELEISAQQKTNKDGQKKILFKTKLEVYRAVSEGFLVLDAMYFNCNAPKN